MSIAAARLGPASAAAYDLVIMLSLMVQVLVWGMAQGVSISMAQKLGRGRPGHANGIVAAGMAFCYTVTAVLAATVYLALPWYARFASDDEEVRDEILSARLVASAMILVYASMFVVVEILSKQGRVAAVWLTLVPLTQIIAVPVAFSMSHTYGISAIFYGCALTYLLGHLFLAVLVLNSDWAALAKQAAQQQSAASSAKQAEQIEGVHS